MSKASQVIVLTEDRRQQTFVRQYLKRLGYRGDQIRTDDLPAGEGSGELFVRQRYAKNVDAYRSRAARAATALIVVIDADTADVTRRVAQLTNALENANLPLRTVEEKIAHLIPKRNIETWILCLNGRMVDEESDYSRERDVDPQIAPAAIAFFEGNRTNLQPPDHWVDSLRLAIPEAVRLE
jgi:hypothetical protein